MVIILSAIFFNSLALGKVVSIRSCFIRAETMFLSIAFLWADVRFKRRTCFPWCISNVEFKVRRAKKKKIVCSKIDGYFSDHVNSTQISWLSNGEWVSVVSIFFFVKDSPTMLARASIRKGLYHARLGMTVTSCKSLCFRIKASGLNFSFPKG